FMTRTLRYGEEAAGWVAEHRLPLNVADVWAPDSPVGSRDWIREHGIRSLLAMPVMHNEVLLAVVTLTGREPFRLGPDDHEQLDTFLAQASSAIRNAALYSETDRRRREAEEVAERLRALDEVNRLVSSSLNPDEVLQNIAAA